MALYRETYRLSRNFPGFPELKKKLDSFTGLINDIEELTKNSVVVSNTQLKTDIEVIIESEKHEKKISLYFAPRKRKNYFEWALIHVLNEYLEDKYQSIPAYAEKKWIDLNFYEKHFR